MLHYIAAAALAGLAGSPHCIGMCGSFALACGGRISGSAAWHAGKILTYATMGAIAGGAGSVVPGPAWVASLLSALLMVWFAAALAGLVAAPALRTPGLATLASRVARKEDMASRLLFGMANGLLPCGLVYATLGIAVASGNPLVGAASMAAFGMGTIPALAAVSLGLRKLLDRSTRARRLTALVVLLAGLWAVASRGGLVATGEGSHHAPSAHEVPTERH
ncbi:MAG: sulfite exporter TauE/SafE family protein [Gemmatimonadota bacterium]|nr:sulfite exporter TauE/SafE family protein [Gemmatimonadota bacterium]MDH5760625.1 sulfite exporter TauE/SafE family protein [Gemmatimonadota bacterium]